MQRHHLERVLFVVGNRHSGKSTQLRSLFQDFAWARVAAFPKTGSWRTFTGSRTTVLCICG
jgi:hypothetical protein